MHNFSIQTFVFATSLKREDHRRYPHEKTGFKPVSGMYSCTKHGLSLGFVLERYVQNNLSQLLFTILLLP